MFPLLRSLRAQGRLALLPAVLALLAAALAVPTSALARQPSRPLAVDESPASRYAAWIRGTFREAAFFSSSLGRTLWYFVYLPPDYFESERAYPTLYLLHGGGGDKEEWPAYGLVDTLDELIMAGEVRPLILVLPHGDSSYWVNHVDGPRWGDYVALDLVEHVDATYRTLPSGASNSASTCASTIARCTRSGNRRRRARWLRTPSTGSRPPEGALHAAHWSNMVPRWPRRRPGGGRTR